MGRPRPAARAAAALLAAAAALLLAAPRPCGAAVNLAYWGAQARAGVGTLANPDTALGPWAYGAADE
jgi:hypothetical protein